MRVYMLFYYDSPINARKHTTEKNTLSFSGKIILAPMAGVGDAVFRQLCREHGADMVVTEMVSADGLRYNSAATRELMAFAPRERPVGIQLFGANPDYLAAATEFACREYAPDFIDLNAGCPVRKVVARNGGSSLLRDRPLFEKIVRAMVRASNVPVTVKLRSGWNGHELVDVDFARCAEQEGVAAVTLHARTRAMGFSGTADWSRIAMVKKSVAIPVIGNGDVVDGSAAQRMFAQTGCDSVMIGRGAYGNPWIFTECRTRMAEKRSVSVSKSMRCETVLEHLKRYREHYGDKRAAREMKKHVAWYIKGMPGASGLRNDIFQCNRVDDLVDIVKKYFWMNRGTGFSDR